MIKQGSPAVDEAAAVHVAISSIVELYARQMTALATENAALRAKLTSASVPKAEPEPEVKRDAGKEFEVAGIRGYLVLNESDPSKDSVVVDLPIDRARACQIAIPAIGIGEIGSSGLVHLKKVVGEALSARERFRK